MFLAAKSGDAAKMEQFLGAGADVNSRDENNDTPLIIAGAARAICDSQAINSKKRY